ncbi:MAG: hypothetical protein RBR97_20700 [Bacteroidales bacterium]|nr:hypothetical protein [Bacteroidales bacterium]
MTNEETKAEILEWCGTGNRGQFSWPTDACGYDQHIKFVKYRNEYWKGQCDFIEFVKEYAEKVLI